MMRRNAVAAGVMIPAPAADPDTISDSGSSTSVPPPKPARKQTYSASQEVEGSASAVIAGTAINRYLRTHGRIPMTRPKGSDLDLNAQPPSQVERPVICAYCNCAFCFGVDEVPSLNPRPGLVYPVPPAPITLNLLTPPAVGPLCRCRGPGAMPARLLVCSCENHFMVTMGMMQQQPGGMPPVVWQCTPCLRVLPIVVGSEGASSPDLRANRAPPPEPWTYAGAYWNYVEPGHEDMVKLKLHGDPLNLTLGRR